jgi:hypothetical protein
MMALRGIACVILAACMAGAIFYFVPPVGFGPSKPARPIFTLYADQWTCTKPSQELDALGRVMCDQFTAKVSK